MKPPMTENLLDKSRSEKSTKKIQLKEYKRFTLSERIEHIVLLVTFTTLAITGLAQKFATDTLGAIIINAFGGIELTRIIHRGASIGLMAVSVYHIIAVLYRVIVRKRSLHMFPVFEDFKHVYEDILFYIGRRKSKARYGRFSYAEKAEYLAVVWGTVIMAITGFLMWNPIASTRFFPGEAIPAAKAAHGGEALLAVLAIILWHFYHVHLRHFNRSIFTGKLTREEMLHEHPADLERIEAGIQPLQPTPEEMKKRMRIFLPGAILLTAAMLFGLFKFITFEETAITTVPPGESVAAFVRQTPTAAPTVAPMPTADPSSLSTWNAGIGDLLSERCSACHGPAAIGGLDITTYEQTLSGGVSGAAVVPGNSVSSILMQIQTAGDHPGQLVESELSQIENWIANGAPQE
jgi:cytochrome b subunit of formate dehydrogenase/mono/diheme cytochrome c family protein